jgi:large subunit ribosomal protein L11
MKKLNGIIKLKLYAGKASSAPPVGSVLGIFKLNINEFCKDFNSRTSTLNDELLLNIKVFVYNDRTYDMIISMPSLHFFLASITSYSFVDPEEVVQITPEIIYEIAFIKNISINDKTNIDYPSVNPQMFRTVFGFLLSTRYVLPH